MCIYRLLISIDLSETAQKRGTGNMRQNSVRDNIREFFSDKIFFPIIFFLTIFFLNQKKKKIVRKKISLNFLLSEKAFYLRLNFVSDYIPQLYFVCNDLISSVVCTLRYVCNYSCIVIGCSCVWHGQSVKEVCYTRSIPNILTKHN